MFHFYKFYVACSSLAPFFLFLINLFILLFNFTKKDITLLSKNNSYYIIIIQNIYIYIILIILIYDKSIFIQIHFLKIALSSYIWILFVVIKLSYFNKFIESLG